jgi:hypothetical protein
MPAPVRVLTANFFETVLIIPVFPNIIVMTTNEMVVAIPIDMQPSMRLADEPNPGAIWYNYFFPRPLAVSDPFPSGVSGEKMQRRF